MGEIDERERIRVEREGGVAVVTIDRPEAKNALTLAMWRRLADAFENLAADETTRATVLTGAGGAFSAGADIKEFAQVRDTPADAEIYAEAVERANRAVSGAPAPTLAAVSGPAFGGGCGLALCCDLRFADARARFAIPAARLGIVYGVEETRALVEAVGLAQAREILFTAAPVDAERAVEIGLARGPVAPDALAAAKAAAAQIAENAPLSVRGAKRALTLLTRGDTPERRAALAEATRRAVESADYAEGRRAFAERRPPRFTGR